MQTQTANNIPWRGKELKRFWAMTHSAGMSNDDIYSIIKLRFEKERMHELSRNEFIRLMTEIARKQTRYKNEFDSHFKGTPMEPSWRYIRYLQRRLGWDDRDLATYVSWHGKKIGANIDNLKWLTVSKAHGIITGMKKILENSEKGEDRR